MDKSFKRFKARALSAWLIKSILLGGAVGLLSSGVLLLFWRFEIWPLGLTLSIPVGIGSALSSALLYFFLVRRSESVIAARLDREFALEERVGTMLQYREETSAIHELQRNDANLALSKIPTKGMGMKTVWIYALSLVLSALVFTSSFVFRPKVEETPPPPETPFALTELQEAALRELIEKVATSEMRSPYRENVVLAITALLDELIEADTEREKNDAVAAACELILTEVDESSFALELIEAVWNVGTDPAKRIAEMLNYYAWPKADEDDRFYIELSDVEKSFVHADSMTEYPDKDKMREDTALLLSESSVLLLQALITSKMPVTDELYVEIVRLASANETQSGGAHIYGFSTIGALPESYDYNDLQHELDECFGAIGGEILYALKIHKASTSTGENAVTRICSLLDCTAPTFERPVMRDISSGGITDPGGDEGGGAAGGIGGGTEYGSDDLVLDPNTNTYVEYGTILDRYYAIMFAKLQDGSYTDAERAAMEKYFAILYGGFEE